MQSLPSLPPTSEASAILQAERNRVDSLLLRFKREVREEEARVRCSAAVKLQMFVRRRQLRRRVQERLRRKQEAREAQRQQAASRISGAFRAYVRRREGRDWLKALREMRRAEQLAQRLLGERRHL